MSSQWLWVSIILLLFTGSILTNHASSREKENDKKESKFLMLDSRIIKKTENAMLRIGEVKKHAKNPLFKTAEYPWETYSDNLYPNVIYDDEEKLYKCWYISVLRIGKYDVTDELAPKDKDWGSHLKINYATSKDGIEWAKPRLDVFTYKNEPTNVVAAGVHGSGIIKDIRDPDPERRYKMFTGLGFGKVGVSFSPDGIHWNQVKTVKTGDPRGNLRADTHNHAFWAPEQNRYVAISRGWPDRIRTVVRMESEDFLNWSDPVEVFRGPRETQTYSMPVFHYAGLYLGLASMYRETTDRRVYLELTWSTDTIHWERVEPAAEFIPLGAEPEDYDYGTIYAAFAPIVEDDQVRIYYGATQEKHTHLREVSSFALATLRPDGFAGYEPQDRNKPGIITTELLTITGGGLKLSADIGDGGYVCAAIFDDSGTPVSDFTFETCRKITNDVTDHSITWNDGIGLSALKGKKVVMKFKLYRAKLYSISGSIERH